MQCRRLSHARRHIFAIAIVIVYAFHLIGDSNKTRSRVNSGQLMSPNSTCTATIHERQQLENVYAQMRWAPHHIETVMIVISLGVHMY